MSVVTLKRWNISMGAGQPLAVIAGLNVLENLDLALEVGRELKAVTAQLGLPYVFKASFDKANRSSITSYRGPGLKDGLAMLAEIKAKLDVPIATDIHEVDQAEPVAAVADLVQIPAFLCRQTDLIVAASRATAALAMIGTPSRRPPVEPPLVRGSAPGSWTAWVASMVTGTPRLCICWMPSMSTTRLL